MARLHHRPEDFEEGDLYARLWAFNYYALENLPITVIDLDEWSVDVGLLQDCLDDMIADSIYPPLIFDPIAGSIIDGAHRANAAARLGHATVRAYVGQGARTDPIGDEDGDEDEDERSPFHLQ